MRPVTHVRAARIDVAANKKRKGKSQPAGGAGGLSALKVPQLKEQCRAAGLPVGGTKAVLIERLQAATAPAAAAPAPAAPEPPRVFDDADPELSRNQSTAGRVAWKKAHRKGEFGKPKKRLKKFSKGDGFRMKKF